MKSNSQAGQDLFVLQHTNFLKNGLFVDIAAADPFYINNTAVLEQEYGWDGISIELDSQYNNKWENRKSLFLNKNAFDIDYEKIFNDLLKKHNKIEKKLNYLSLDLEPPELTNKLLHLLPLKTFTFDVITYEHDSYRVGEVYKNDAKNYLLELGYELAVENVGMSNYIFEDWYVFKN